MNYKMAKNGILITVPIILIILTVLLINKNGKETESINICHLGGSKNIKLIYIMSKRSHLSDKSHGCSLCDSDNQDQWKTLYRVYGGREYIEFIVIFPDEVTKHTSPNISYDVGLISEKGTKYNEDVFVICNNAEELIEQNGRVDMNFVRKAHAILSMAYLDNND